MMLILPLLLCCWLDPQLNTLSPISSWAESHGLGMPHVGKQMQRHFLKYNSDFLTSCNSPWFLQLCSVNSLLLLLGIVSHFLTLPHKECSEEHLAKNNLWNNEGILVNEEGRIELHSKRQCYCSPDCRSHLVLTGRPKIQMSRAEM